MLRYSPISSLTSLESIVHSCSIGGRLWVDLVFPLEWTLWISQHLLYFHFHSQTKHKTQTQDFTFSLPFCKITFIKLPFLPWGDDLGILFQVKHRQRKTPCDWGALLFTFPHFIHFVHSTFPHTLSVALSLVWIRVRVTLTHTHKPYTHLRVHVKGLGSTTFSNNQGGTK